MLERTLKLLMEGSRLASNSASSVTAPSSTSFVQCNVHKTHISSLPSSQLRINSSGKLVATCCCDLDQDERQQIFCHNDGQLLAFIALNYVNSENMVTYVTKWSEHIHIL